MSSEKTLFAVDSFLNQSGFYKTSRIAFITNNAAVTSTGELSRVALLRSEFKIVKLFSPEHGIDTSGVDGAFQKNNIDPITKLPVISLYSKKLMPDEEDLKDIDIVLFDIPDVGARFYTYLWTLTYIMEACVALKKPLIILDRPNPLSGNLSLVEGPMLDEKNCSSFIGRWNIPIRHSSTYGELANHFLSVKRLALDIKVIRIGNWNRNEFSLDKGWKFTPTSPAIRDAETALLYPGLGLFEGINVNEGRGTKMPFKIFGAPWIKSNILLEEFQNLSLPGLKANQIKYVPTDSVYANEICSGLKFSVTDTKEFRPVLSGLQLIRLIQVLFRKNCKERMYKTVANPTGEKHLDKLTGILDSFEKIKSGELIEKYYNADEWKETITPHLLY